MFDTGTFILFCILGSSIGSENIKDPKLRDWPCPLAEDIAPCTCDEYYGPGKIQILCDNVVQIEEIERALNI